MDESALKILLDNLDRSQSSLHHWLHFWTFLVVVGVVMEVVFVVWEYAEDLYEFRRGIVRPPEKPSILLLILGLLGAGLVAVGVAGELYIDVQAGKLETQIRKANEDRFLLLSKEAGDAASSAKTAHEELRAVSEEAAAAKQDSNKAKATAGASETEARSALYQAKEAGARAGKAEASLGKAEAEAKSAETSASNALTLAREARQEAASFESDLTRLKQQAADRVLDEYQQEQVRLRIAPFLGTPYELAVADSPEAEKLMAEIDAALGSAGWAYKVSESKTFRLTKKLRNGHQVDQISLRGVEIGLTTALWVKLKPAADGLAKALTSEGIASTVVTLPQDDPSPNNIHIMVGTKP